MANEQGHTSEQLRMEHKRADVTFKLATCIKHICLLLTMGQYWRVVNLDKCQSYFLSKLGESLNGGRECFRHLLPTRILLSDSDSAVQRYSPGESDSESLWQRNKKFTDTPFFAKTASHSLDAAAPVNFPVEIGRSEIYRRITALATNYSWAGDRIICVGDYLWNEDIPEGLLSAEEKKNFLLDQNNNERTLYEYPFHETKPVSLLTLLADLDLWDEYHWRDMRVFRQLCESSPMLLPLPGPHVLRNLTRKQYVRESAILALRDKHRGTMDDIGFGEVLLFRICLSSDPSRSLAYGGDIGAWAGDRFDVVSADWSETGAAGGWTDASDEALRAVEAIWVDEYAS